MAAVEHVEPPRDPWALAFFLLVLFLVMWSAWSHSLLGVALLLLSCVLLYFKLSWLGCCCLVAWVALSVWEVLRA